MSTTRGQSGTAESSTTSMLFQCAVPGCQKAFRRKEHLTRHLKSHDTEPQYVCHICGRRYARSDVLKRHVEFHPQYYKPKRNFIACTRCRESKTKCDEETPCKPCHRRALPCVRASGSEANVNAEGGTAPESSTDSLSPPASPMHLVHEESKLGEHLARDPVAAERRLGVYWTEIHPTWPVLQPPAFAESGSPSLLIASMAMLVSWLEGDADHLELFPLVLEEITQRQLDLDPPLPVLQATVLFLLYGTCCLAAEGMAPKVIRIHNALVAACRFAGIFATQRGVVFASSHAEAEEEYQEQRHRLAFAVLRLDAYLSTLMDFPPLLRYQELSMPLYQSTCWVHVDSEEERRRLLDDEPTLRKNTAFSFRVHDLFGTPRSNALAPPWTKMDYHFILCAMQSGAWEACHQSIRSLPDDLHSRTHSQDFRLTWRAYLSTWASGLENDCQNYFTVSRGDDVTPQTLLLWHMTALRLNTPHELWQLQGRYYNFRPAGPPPKQNPHDSLRPWQGAGVARVAVWHSAQIARIADSEFELGAGSARLRLDPLLLPALLQSAAVACVYAYHTRGCPLCDAASPPVDLVRLFATADDGCDRLDRWLAEGAGLPNWGQHVFTGFPLCQCSLPQLSRWFREFLAGDELVDAAMMRFLGELKAGWW
ncbi:hypothetical protein F5Y14DRAFT_443325 [Nemania sp. NC0429]|nr:hypothetical protein F5Y14DRAFT_443325 [Nemania sp. NC0429]